MLAQADAAIRAARDDPTPALTVKATKQKFATACSAYYAAAAASRRRDISDTDKHRTLGDLFRLRVSLEREILTNLGQASDAFSTACTPSFFGVSRKQGVSIRLPLLSCVPTAACGGRCYGHDGRDREIHIVFRAILNYLIAQTFEVGDETARLKVLTSLQPIVRFGVEKSLEDMRMAAAAGFRRPPRIRFGHIGEIAATPAFANSLAAAIKTVAPEIHCVAYTRHPEARNLDTNLFVVNFTIDGDSDHRQRFAPPKARIVASAWDGRLTSSAAVNFLEHHVEKHARATGTGVICPATAEGHAGRSCDDLGCAACFLPPITDVPNTSL